jgi:1-aminocyclopropane-1-carboxylate deaminase/D-cysteine desulfhydrase-like pyridoxal-dependent ACC family enzyme
MGTPDLTPVEEHGGYLVKRDDLFAYPDAGSGGKVRTCLALAIGAREGLCTAGARQSPQAVIVAAVAAAAGLSCRVHTAAGATTPELERAAQLGAQVVAHRPGYNSVIVSRCHHDALVRGWTEIPFGMECTEAVAQTAAQVANLPEGIARLVVPVGSGMSLAGILAGLARLRRALPVLGVRVGADPSRRLDRFAPGWRARCELVRSALPYHRGAPSCMLGSLELDPIYEAKALAFLRPRDALWVVGKRP